MRIAIGSDHGGLSLKNELREHLQAAGHTVDDRGTHSADAVDYPRIAFDVASQVARGDADVAVIIDGAGIGSCMAANKVPGVRAAMCYDVSSARNSREHNNANVLTLGAGLIGAALAKQIVDTWLKAECTVDRHQKRAAMLGEIEAAWMEAASGGAVAPRPGGTKAVPSGSTTPVVPNWNSVSDALGGSAGRDIGDSDLERIAQHVRTLLLERGGILSEGMCQQLPPDTLQHFIKLGVCRVTSTPGAPSIPDDLASYIDHTLLRPEATTDQIKKLCAEAREHGFASVCINPSFVKLAAGELRGTPVDVCTVVGFPLGSHAPEIKATEARRALRDGAREIDMVIDVGALKGKNDELVLRDIRGVVEACREAGALSKVIIEAALLDDEEKERACRLARKAKADYVKTSTGFGPGGATAHDVALMSSVVRGTRMGVKAAGGIRSLEDAQAMIAAGATRLGASASLKILEEAGASQLV